jgi:hypothetical protein
MQFGAFRHSYSFFAKELMSMAKTSEFRSGAIKHWLYRVEANEYTLIPTVDYDCFRRLRGFNNTDFAPEANGITLSIILPFDATTGASGIAQRSERMNHAWCRLDGYLSHSEIFLLDLTPSGIVEPWYPIRTFPICISCRGVALSPVSSIPLACACILANPRNIFSLYEYQPGRPSSW